MPFEAQPARSACETIQPLYQDIYNLLERLCPQQFIHCLIMQQWYQLHSRLRTHGRSNKSLVAYSVRAVHARDERRKHLDSNTMAMHKRHAYAERFVALSVYEPVAS